MVIHDLKHPTESLVSQLGLFQQQLDEARMQTTALFEGCFNNEQKQAQQIKSITLALDILIKIINEGIKTFEIDHL